MIYDLTDGTGDAERVIAKRVLDKEIDKYVKLRSYFEKELSCDEDKGEAEFTINGDKKVEIVMD